MSFLSSIIIYYQINIIMSSNSKHKCDYCLNISKDPINLICEHILCFACGSLLLKVQTENELQSKYRITCPKCKRITYTYDINNLLLSSSCSVTRNFSSQNQEIKKKKNTLKKNTEKSQQKNFKKPTADDNSKNKKKVSDANFCKTHRLPFTLYCETQAVIICQKCKNSHNPSHKLHELSGSLPLIIKKNIQLRTEGKDQLAQIQQKISKFLKTKDEYQDSYKKLSNQILNEFRILQSIIFKRKQQLKNQLDYFFQPKMEQIDSKIADLSELRNKLKSCNNIRAQTPEREIHFLKNYSSLKQWISKVDQQIFSLSKNSVTLQKGGSTDNIKNEVRNFLCLNLWTKKNTGKLVTPSQYFSQLKTLNKHKLTHSSSNFTSQAPNIVQPPKKSFHQKSKASKLKQYGI